MKSPGGLLRGLVRRRGVPVPGHSLGSSKSLSQQLRPLAWWLLVLLSALVGISFVTYRGGVGLAGFLNGESVWSKAQKQAGIDLMEYVNSGDPNMLASFDQEYALLENDKVAREGISHGTMPWEEVKQALRRGTDIPEAAPGVAFMLKNGSDFPYVKDALYEWRGTDDDVAELKAIADRLREPTAVKSLSMMERQQLHDHILMLIRRIEPGTKRFSLSMAQGASKLHLAIFLTFVFVVTAAAAIWFRAAARILGGIRRTDDRIRLLFDTAADAIVVVDGSTGEILDANRAAASWCGVPVNEIRGRPFVDLFDDELDQGATESGHTRYLVTANHGRLPVEIQSSTAEVSGESVRLELMRDVSERMTIERERRVSQVMGHEMRTPLNAIFLATKSLMNPNVAVERAELLNAVNANSQLLLRRISDTIDLVSINKGAFTYSIEPFRLATLLERVRDVVVPQANGREQTVRFHVEADENIEVLGDVDRIGQAITNIATNACKYSPEGSEIVVEVRDREMTPDEVTLEFRVIDNGVGIPDDAKKLLFRVEYQSAKKRSANYEGLGLGLFIVRTISDQVGASLPTVEDNPDPRGGTIFTWSLPMKRAHKSALDALSDAARSTAVKKPVGSALRCLVADDTRTNRRLLKLTLEQEGHIVLEATNGAEALHAILTTSLDVVLLDMNMPIMTGDEVLTALRTIDSPVSLPAIVAVSADVTVNRSTAALEKGVVAYVSKPIDIDRLLGILSSIAEVRAARFEVEGLQVSAGAGAEDVKVDDEELGKRKLAVDYMVRDGNKDAVATFRRESELAMERYSRDIEAAIKITDISGLRAGLRGLKTYFLLADYQRGAKWCDGIIGSPLDRGGLDSVATAVRGEIGSARHKLADMYRKAQANELIAERPRLEA